MKNNKKTFGCTNNANNMETENFDLRNGLKTVTRS